MQRLDRVRELPEEQSDCVFAEAALLLEVLAELAAVAVLHDQVDVVLGLLAVVQADHILMLQLSQFFEYFDFFLERRRRFGEVLLHDDLHGDLQVFLGRVAAAIDDGERAGAQQAVRVELEIAERLNHFEGASSLSEMERADVGQ